MTLAERRDYVVDRLGFNSVYAYWVADKIHPSKKVIDTESLNQILMSKPKPFVKWVGGKRQLLSQFKDNGLYPPATFDPLTSTYHEPFVGGGPI